MNRKNKLADLQNNLVYQLRTILMEGNSSAQKKQLLQSVADYTIFDFKSTQLYHDTLLFLLAYPQNEELLKLTKHNLKLLCNKLSDYFSEATEKEKWKWIKTGLIFSTIKSTFSFTITKWILKNFKNAASFNSSEADFETLKIVFRQLLPPGICEVYFENNYSLKQLAIKISGDKKVNVLEWTIIQFENSALNENSREQLFALLKIYIDWNLTVDAPSRTTARGSSKKIFFLQNEPLIKSVDFKTVVSKPDFKKLSPDSKSKQQLVNAARGILCSLYRETDPVTYARINETEYFEMERGITIALFYMQPAFRLPLESYVGYMAFRNNIPIAYGGGWIFQQSARFGINILSAFRGGESAFIFSELIRLYHHHFGVNYFHIEPYQIGQKNPDGIKSGAFWFYYRLGFRPMQIALSDLAATEFEKINHDKSYRTEKKILLKLADAEMMIDFSSDKQKKNSPLEIAHELEQHVSKNYRYDFNACSVFEKKDFLNQLRSKKIKFHLPENSLLLSELMICFNLYSQEKNKSVSELKTISKLIESKCAAAEIDFIRVLQQFDSDYFSNQKTPVV